MKKRSAARIDASLHLDGPSPFRSLRTARVSTRQACSLFALLVFSACALPPPASEDGGAAIHRDGGEPTPPDGGETAAADGSMSPADAGPEHTDAGAGARRDGGAVPGTDGGTVPGTDGGPDAGLRVRAIAPAVVEGNVLAEPTTGWRGFGLGISLFYAPAIPRDEYVRVVDEVAAAGIELARFSGSTLTWGNGQGRPEVIPFLPGRHPYYPDDPDVGSWTNEPSPAFFDELGWRLDYAARRGIRVQYTILWGAFGPMFANGDRLRETPTRRFVQYAAERLRRHPEHVIEIINEADHGHHMGRFGREGRIAAITQMARWIREVHPSAVLSVSDGGRQPDSDGAPYFDYHDIAELDYWNVHFPRDELLAEGIPRWARGVWHLYGDRDAFAARHPRKGYGRNDENMFLQTEEDHALWPYRSSTRDYRMYATMMWVSTIAGVGFTLHSQKGFFAQPGLTLDPIFGAIAALRRITQGFPFAGARSYNTSWAQSPVRAFDGPFKVFALISSDRRDLLVYVLNPAGSVTLDLEHAGMHGTAYDPLSGRVLREFDPPAGVSTLTLPAPAYEHGMVLRIRGGL
jgi:hypothetical protein